MLLFPDHQPQIKIHVKFCLNIIFTFGKDLKRYLMHFLMADITLWAGNRGWMSNISTSRYIPLGYKDYGLGWVSLSFGNSNFRIKMKRLLIYKFCITIQNALSFYRGYSRCYLKYDIDDKIEMDTTNPPTLSNFSISLCIQTVGFSSTNNHTKSRQTIKMSNLKLYTHI